MDNKTIIQKIWNLCNVLRGDGISYNEYISELTYLLFLKIAEETKTEHLLPVEYRWENLIKYEGDNLLGHYQLMLTHLGVAAESKAVREIYAFPTTVFSHSENLKVVIDGINKIDWHSIKGDGIGDIYEGLLAKNSEDARSGAGQYFTPRALVETIIHLAKPKLGELIQDPAVGTGGFLILADHYLRHNNSATKYENNPPTYQGVEIERGTYRLCLMNIFLHKMKANIFLGDALTEDAKLLDSADLILANPPFGSKVGGARKGRTDISFPTTNKQLEFLQHIYMNLKDSGRAAVVLPDNVLFEESIGKKVRHELMNLCNLHTILRLPSGIFYSQGIKTNVLFFSKGQKTESVWVYDMRTNMPQLGKRKPLTLEHFKDFIARYGEEENDYSSRVDEGNKSRFRKFTRQSIAKNKDSLDINWLDPINGEQQEDYLEPEEIITSVMEEFDGIKKSLNRILEAISLDEKNE